VRAVQSPLRPPSGFDYPLGGFTLPARAGYVSRRRRSWAFPSELHIPRGIHDVSAGMNPHTVLLSGITARRSERAGPESRGSWALTLARVPRGGSGVSAPDRRMLPWAFPFRARPRRPRPGFRPASSHALTRNDHKDRNERRLRVLTAAAWPHPRAHRSATECDSPHRVPCRYEPSVRA
jgi:hypothetical protein